MIIYLLPCETIMSGYLDSLQTLPTTYPNAVGWGLIVVVLLLVIWLVVITGVFSKEKFDPFLTFYHRSGGSAGSHLRHNSRPSQNANLSFVPDDGYNDAYEVEMFAGQSGDAGPRVYDENYHEELAAAAASRVSPKAHRDYAAAYHKDHAPVLQAQARGAVHVGKPGVISEDSLQAQTLR